MMTFSENTREEKVTKSDLRRMFLRSMTFEGSWDYERQMYLANAFTLAPIIEKLYPADKDRAEALKRHLEFFNITPYLSTIVCGIVAAMEEMKANGGEISGEAISNVKTSLMGPLSGIGDSLFLTTWRTVTAGIGCSIAMQGNPLGAVMFFLLFNIPAQAIRYFGAIKGYEMGSKLLAKIAETNIMEKLTKLTGVVGMMAVGAMIASMVSVTTPLTYGSGEEALAIQGVLDQIMPCLLPAIATAIIYSILGKRPNTAVVLIGIVAFSIVCSAFGIL